MSGTSSFSKMPQQGSARSARSLRQAVRPRAVPPTRSRRPVVCFSSKFSRRTQALPPMGITCDFEEARFKLAQVLGSHTRIGPSLQRRRQRGARVSRPKYWSVQRWNRVEHVPHLAVASVSRKTFGLFRDIGLPRRPDHNGSAHQGNRIGWSS